MKTAALVLLMLLGICKLGIAYEGRADGEMLAKVASVERIRDHREYEAPYTIYTVIVFRDSCYAGSPAVPGDSLGIWTPGGPAIAFYDGREPLSTVTMVPGEKIFVFYRKVDGKLFAVDKWTVWRRGAVRTTGNARARRDLGEEDLRLEAMLADPARAGVLPDSLELFHTRMSIHVLANPIPGPGVTWRDYGLLGRSEGTLRTILNRSRSGTRE